MDFAAIDRTLHWLDSSIGNYPPHFSPAYPEPETRARLDSLANSLNASATRATASAEIEWRLGELYRMAHNLDVPDAWDASETHLKRALSLDAGSAMAHLVLGGLYLTTDPAYDAVAELHFRAVLQQPVDSVAQTFHAVARANRGLFELCLRRNDIPQAVGFAKKVLNSEPGDSQLRQLVADMGSHPTGWQTEVRRVPGPR